MENNSISQPLHDSQIIWDPQAFSPGPTALAFLTAFFAGIVGLALALGIFVLFHQDILHGAPIRPLIHLTDALWIQLAFEAPIVATILIRLPSLAKLSYRQLGFSLPSGRVMLIALLGALAMMFLTDVSANLITNFTHSKHQQDVVELLKQAHNPATIIAFIVFAVLLAPIAEETVFRLFLFNIGRRYGGFWVGAVASAVLFGLAHGDIYFAIPLALAGLVLATVYERSRNAFCSMFVHATFNATTVVALFASGALKLH